MYIQYRSKYSSHSVVLKRYKSLPRGKENAQRLFQIRRLFLRTVVLTRVLPYRFLLPTNYACLTICTEDLLLLHPVIARLSTETANFVSFRSPACLFLHAFRRSLLLLVTVIFTVVSLSVTSSLTCFKTGISADTVTCFPPARAQVKI